METIKQIKWENERDTTAAASCRTAIVVDVDDRASASIARALTEVGTGLVWCRSVEEALEVVLSSVTLVLIDAIVRDDVITRGVPRLRRHFTGASIVVMTDYPSLPTAVAAVKSGADDCVAKPLSAREIASYAANLTPLPTPTALDSLAPPTLARIEWEYISRVMARYRGNLTVSARVLGIRRSTLQRKLKKVPPRS